MVKLGNLFYRTRLYVFPLACLLVFLPGPHIFADDLVAALAGFLVALAGQVALEYARTRQEDQQARQREDVEARAIEDIAELDHHLTAMMPQKLYHLKNTST
jgi:positive regulator of sigma E activity